MKRTVYLAVFFYFLLVLAVNADENGTPFQSRFKDIFQAAERGTVGDVRHFLDKGADVNAKNNIGWAPIHYAAMRNPSVDVTQLLIAQGADVNTKNTAGKTPLDIADSEEKKAIIREAGGNETETPVPQQRKSKTATPASAQRNSGTGTSVSMQQSVGTLSMNDRAAVDGVLRDFYNKYSLPGGISVAISYREKLLYAGAVGYADKEHKIPLTPKHQMRIASISKSVTAIAVMKLAEERKLNLNEEVFGETGIFKGEYGVPKYENSPVKITVKQLLEHTAGGWGHSKKDPVSNISGKELIRTTIREYPIEHLPGTKYDYSNFGYWVLGRVIEKKSGMTYEEYVKKNILMPCGISGMRIGAVASGPDEVEHIGDNDKNPYRSPSHRDANGGWIANPIELM